MSWEGGGIFLRLVNSSGSVRKNGFLSSLLCIDWYFWFLKEFGGRHWGAGIYVFERFDDGSKFV